MYINLKKTTILQGNSMTVLDPY